MSFIKKIFVLLIGFTLTLIGSLDAQHVNIWLEAEDTDVKLPFYVYDDAEASDGTYLSTPRALAKYEFHIESAGDYYLWYRAINPEKGAAFFFYLDSLQNKRFMGNDRSNPDVWYWKSLTARESETRISYPLTKGPHVLYLHCPEGNINVDALFLTKDQDLKIIQTIVPKSIRDQGVWIEAENGILDGPFSIISHPEYNAKKYLTIEANPLQFKFSITREDDYMVYGRLRTPSGGDDSFYFKMDGELKYHSWNNIPREDGWYFAYTFDSETPGKERMPYHLKPGDHTFYIKQREDGTQLDGILITNDLENKPDTGWIK